MFVPGGCGEGGKAPRTEIKNKLRSVMLAMLFCTTKCLFSPGVV